MSLAVLEREVEAHTQTNIVPAQQLLKKLNDSQRQYLLALQADIQDKAIKDLPIPSARTFYGFQPAMWQIQAVGEGFRSLLGFVIELRKFAADSKRKDRSDARNINSNTLFVGRAQYYQSVCRDMKNRSAYVCGLVEDYKKSLSSNEAEKILNERDIEYISQYSDACSSLIKLIEPIEKIVSNYIDDEYARSAAEYQQYADMNEHPTLIANDNGMRSKPVEQYEFANHSGSVIIFPYTDNPEGAADDNQVGAETPFKEMPSKPKEVKKEKPERLTMNVIPSFKDTLDETANAHGMSVTEFMRRAAMAAFDDPSFVDRSATREAEYVSKLAFKRAPNRRAD